MKYKTFNTKEDILGLIRLNCGNEVFVSVLGWQDGDYFIKLCLEEGMGISAQEEDFFKNIPINMKTNDKELEDLVKFIDSHPYLKSNNRNIIHHYDLHVWCSNNYFVFNFFKKEFLEKRLNFFEKLVGKSLRPKWQE